ncbi:hypothetical protein AAC387_Pa05g1393 [Persea americana]
MSTDTRSTGLEFRSSADDAWYSVRLITEEDGEVLRVKYVDFPHDIFDERFRAADFGDSKATEGFAERFRPLSVQLQDEDCPKVTQGKAFCISRSIEPNDLKFYDAVVDEVCHSKHRFENGVEVCMCTFVVLWKHGPSAGTKTSTGIENICSIQSGSTQINPALDSFMKLSRKKLHKGESGISAPKGDTCGTESKDANLQNKLYECESPASYFKGAERCKHAVMVRTTKGKSRNGSKIMGQDRDLGGGCFRTKHLETTSSCLFIVIENLEKDISPSAIVDFIYQQTSISCKAFVSPSLLSEAYTRGALCPVNQEKLECLSRFLHSPAHLIVSSRGRPWVITEKKWRLGTFGSMMPKSEEKLQNKNEIDGKVKVVLEGTKEYENGKRLRDLFLEFCEHQQCLHKRLALQEQKLINRTIIYKDIPANGEISEEIPPRLF